MNITINTNNPIIGFVYNYLFNFEERYTRKNFAAIMLITSIFLIGIYALYTDFNALTTVREDVLSQASNISITSNLTPEESLQKTLENPEYTSSIEKQVTDAVPSILWLCLVMLLSIPAIIKRTNDVFNHTNYSYPVIIYYLISCIEYAFSISIPLGPLGSALSIYSFIFILLISGLPSKIEEEKE
ncbi:MAG TPA: hypothetical protein DCL21_03525 [Alphaproteobacteria bacterium]|nr:hypothetical protein [Alphaproteobacteria bacterium]